MQGTDQAWITCCFNESSRTVCCAIKGTASKFEIRADNGRFFSETVKRQPQARTDSL